ncbi:Putative gentisate 1,2-dioxygenase [Podospora comata]|uniref:Gentisate 1,2-dioxygenase n=1 Tax=Podospora comata TaxID=48703 RepID=A0ABY6RZJ2_PODCO|nr:Putative gentisate 1,2-dioxygenase [Podospora comata]
MGRIVRGHDQYMLKRYPFTTTTHHHHQLKTQPNKTQFTMANRANVSGAKSSTFSTLSTEDQFYTDIASKNVEPLWTVLNKMVPPKPNPSSVVTAWPYEDLRPVLMQSGVVVSAEEAERRVLMLVNPAMQAPYTTDTIYAGLQLILPGETAPAHRHVAFALRFIVEGSRGFTAVEGQKLMMERGDVILTPSWHWHDHGSEGDGPMVWLDGLDLPVYRFLPVNFAENYEEARYPSELSDNSNWKLPWAPVQAVLDENKETETYARYDYKSGEHGKHLSKTISGQAERINAGATTKKVRETVSFVYHVYEGEGYSTIVSPEGKEEKVQWKGKDTFAVPAWSIISHTCTQECGSAYLFAVNDRPMVESLGLYKRQELK